MDVEAAILSSAYCCYCNWSNAKEMSGTNIRRGERAGRRCKNRLCARHFSTIPSSKLKYPSISPRSRELRTKPIIPQWSCHLLLSRQFLVPRYLDVIGALENNHCTIRYFYPYQIFHRGTRREEATKPLLTNQFSSTNAGGRSIAIA